MAYYDLWGIMKKTVFLILMVLIAGLPGCSEQPFRKKTTSGVGVLFDGEPQVFDSSLVFMGAAVGQILSRERRNGVTRISIVLDDQYDNLKKTNLTAVVKNGRLHLKVISGYGDPLPPGGCINGFLNTTSYRLFRFSHVIDNVNTSADRRVQRLLARSGLAR